jgi:predicted transcriptional regulator
VCKLQGLCNLLFELSNEDRLKILLELKKGPMKLSRISEKFGFTVPETARNIARLAEESLIARDVDGYFHLNPIGDVTLQLVPSLAFLSGHKNYFRTHTFSALPPEYVTSIGVLQNSKFVKGVTETFFNADGMVREAKEFVWISVDQILVSTLPLFIEAIERGVEIKKLMPRNADVPDKIMTIANDPFFERAARANMLESRYLDKIDFVLFISEKEVAGITFKNLEGVFDYGSFRSNGEAVISWAKSLFLHYWNRAKRE